MAQYLTLPTFSLPVDFDKSLMTCVYPLSGQYGLLSRIIYYISLLITIFGFDSEWLTAGAGLSAITYSGSAAIHSVILVAGSRKGTFDLDTVGAYLVTSTGLIMIAPILTYNKTFKVHSNESLLGIFRNQMLAGWAVVLLIGMTCAIVAMLRPWPVERLCVSETTGFSLSIPQELDVARFNCTYTCFGGAFVNKSSNGATANETNNIGVYNRIRGGNDSVALPIASIDLLSQTTVNFTAVVITVVAVLNFSLYLWSRPKKHEGQRGYNRWPYIYIGSLVVSPLTLIITIVVAELYWASSGLPQSEGPNSVGQWSAMVAAVLVFIGAAIHYWFGAGKDEKARRSSKKRRVHDRIDNPEEDRTELLHRSREGSTRSLSVGRDTYLMRPL